MTIGEVAAECGINASAIRYYEKAGLLPKAMRSGGQRRYDRSILDRLALLGRAKDCGFTLAEVRQLFHGAPLSARWRDLASRKIVELDALAARIGVMRALLERAQNCRCLDVEECGRLPLKPGDRAGRGDLPHGLA